MPSFTRFLLWLIALLGSTSALLAFPPSPEYTLYGIVRDDMGRPFPSSNANIVLKFNGVEIARSVVSPLVLGDRNYELRVRMDAGRTDKPYDARALSADLTRFRRAQFTVEVIVDDVTHLPIETSVYTPATTNGSPTRLSVPLTVGAPGERALRHFTVGDDSNNDGLPDVWQEAMLTFYELDPTNYGLIPRDGDINHNGISNYQEYITGTYDAIPSQFQLVLTSYTPGIAQFQFYTIFNKTYNIEQSTDLKTWTPLFFAVNPTAERTPFYTATRTGSIQAYANPPVPPAGSGIFFRLTVR